MPLFGKKKGSDKNAKSRDEGLNLDGLSLENLDDDEDNEDSDIDDDEDEEVTSVLKQALSGLDDESDDDEDEEKDEEGEGFRKEDDDDGFGLSKDLLDLFSNEEEVDNDLAALTRDLENVEAASLLTQARDIVEALRRLRQA